MYNNDDLDAAAAAGIFSQQAIDDFRALAARRRHTQMADEEHFRLLSGFNDIFVVIASVLLLVSVGWVAGALSKPLAPWLAAAVSWPLAEYFVRRRRMALPAILLLGSFVLCSGGGMLALCLEWFPGDGGVARPLALLASGLTAALAAWLHWRRFRVPVTVAMGVGAWVAMAALAIEGLLPQWQGLSNGVLAAGGVLAFLLGVHWDRQDPARQKRQSDVAFWLHLLAAPLLVHPLFSMLGIMDGNTGMAMLLAVIALYAVFGLVSLVIDRRALMVSALAYVLYAFNQLLQHAGLQSAGFGVAGLCIASGLLLLSAFWQPCRSAVLRRLPSKLRAWLPPLK
ncbi:hypothetical protein [Chromobacterium sphagni]|uniref:DUF2157 domain-containing protein n=1 Tax=Chromobacterium sphagni TaxID=1903179 RepID=A0ABX3CH64_9NEIS|nr:hypothetical protein [Chromobacterium sphagni]OHX21680.1 hypothetical protein BI344_03995 [Chromobacterium sphagni]